MESLDSPRPTEQEQASEYVRSAVTRLGATAQIDGRDLGVLIDIADQNALSLRPSFESLSPVISPQFGTEEIVDILSKSPPSLDRADSLTDQQAQSALWRGSAQHIVGVFEGQLSSLPEEDRERIRGELGQMLPWSREEQVPSMGEIVRKIPVVRRFLKK